MAPRTVVPKNSDELNDMLNDDKTLATIMNDPGKFREFMKNYVANAATPDLTNEINEQAERVALDFLRTHEVENTKRLNLDPYSRKTTRNSLYNKKALGAKHDDAFETAPSFMRAISEHQHVDAALSRKLGELKNDLSSVKPSDGGFLIPERLRAELLRVALETAVVRSRARVIPMDSLTVPIPTVDSTSNVSSIHGGFTGYWTEEGATLTESQPRFGQIKLTAHKLTLYTEIPNELIRDAVISFEAFMDEMLPEAIAWFEDVAFFLGGGVGEPLGFLNAPAAIEITRTAAGNAIEWPDVTAMYSRMLPQSINRAVWVVAPDTFPNLADMRISSGTDGVWIANGAGADTPPMTILGRPVIVSEKARALGTAGDINFVDFGFYLIGDRQAMSARQSEDFRFNQDVTAFRVIERVDGRPWLQSAITPQNGSSETLSPYVKLADA